MFEPIIPTESATTNGRLLESTRSFEEVVRSAEGRLQNKLNEEVTFLLGVDFEVPPINQRDSMKLVLSC